MSTGTRFPDGFVWGAATSAYQVEGAVAKLGYVPNRAARNLVTRRADSVARSTPSSWPRT